jgi:hypothetical protein
MQDLISGHNDPTESDHSQGREETLEVEEGILLDQSYPIIEIF